MNKTTHHPTRCSIYKVLHPTHRHSLPFSCWGSISRNVHCKVRKQMKNNLLASTDEDLEEGVYDVDGAELYWDGAEWYEESRNDPGHRDGTFGNQYGDWRPIKKNRKKKRRNLKY